MDVVEPAVRSRMMRGIRGSDTKPELIVRQFLHAHGFRFRLHVAGLPGKPDLVLPRFRAVVFVNGCFWHAHPGCRYFKAPATRPDFWTDKMAKNRLRDERVVAQLKGSGWRVAQVWECYLRARLDLKPLAEWIRDTGNSGIEFADPNSQTSQQPGADSRAT